MHRCRWCHRIVWPGQKRNRYGRHVLHRRCAAAVNYMVLREDQIEFSAARAEERAADRSTDD